MILRTRLHTKSCTGHVPREYPNAYSALRHSERLSQLSAPFTHCNRENLSTAPLWPPGATFASLPPLLRTPPHSQSRTNKSRAFEYPDANLWI